MWLAREGDKWSLIPPPLPSLKGPPRYGLFKDAFRNRVMFVYGTTGTPDENAWAFAKARYDAETFWYRGNASVDVVADTKFNLTPVPPLPAGEGGRGRGERDRNVIVYGNADTNAAWNPLLGDSPAQVRRGLVRVGVREFTGDDLACLFIRPRAGSERASVGVVTGSGVKGMRLTDRLPYFSSGVGYPDCLVLGSEVLARAGAGIRAAGYFGLDWSVEKGEWVWEK